MKTKITLLFSAILLVSLAACNQHKETVNDNSKATISMDNDTVDVPTARQYVKNYAVHAGYVDSTGRRGDSTKIHETRCIWFSKERLRAIVRKLDRESGDGVRFYLITYNDKYDTTTLHKTPIPPVPYWGKNTLLMVSTKPSDALHIDYYTNHHHRGAKDINSGFIVGMTPENRGELCPPPANCPQIGATLLAE